MPDVQEVFRMATQKVRPDPGALERQSRTQRRHMTRQRAGAYGLLAVLVIAVLVIGVLALQQPEQRPAGQREQDAPAIPSSSHPFFLDLETGETTPLPGNLAGGVSYVPSPDGTRVAYSSDEGGGCVEGGITVANIDGTDVETIESPVGLTFCSPRWSPDGTKLVYQERNAANEFDVGNLFVHDLSTGQTVQVTHLQLTKAWWWYLSPDFSPGGRDVVFHLPRSSTETTKWDVWSVPVTGGEPTLVMRNAAFPLLRAEGPEGERVVFVEPSTVEFAGPRLMTGRPVPGADLRHTLAEANYSIWWPTLSPDGDRIAYQDGGSIYVVGLFARESREVAEGSTAEWLDFDTLIVTPPE